MSDEVACDEHGHGGATYVCQHVADGTARRLFSEPPTADNPWPDAWCERCEEEAARCGGWNDASEAFADVKLLCSGCYLTRRLLLEAEPDDQAVFPFLYRCGSCDAVHTGLPAWGAPEPLPWFEATDDERTGGELGRDLCVLGDDYFIRGCVEIPILGTRQRMAWGVWTSLSQQSFERTRQHWDDPDRARLDPMFGWLSNRLPEALYPDTFLLKSRVHTRAGGVRPLIILEPTDHPLAIEQRRGITPERAETLAMTLLSELGGSRA